METYEDMRQWAALELLKLGCQDMHLSFGTVMMALRSPGSSEADEACRIFASTLSWPPLTDPVRLEVCLRLACMQWYSMPFAADEEIDVPRGAFAESVLIDYWRDTGRQDWLLEYLFQVGTGAKADTELDPPPLWGQ